MIDLKTFSVVAAASAALIGFSAGHASAETATAPMQLAQANSASSPTGMGTNRGGEMVNPNAVPSGPSSTAPRAAGSDQCAQISDPRSRQDCIQRQNDLRAGQPVGNNPVYGGGSGITNRGSGLH